MANINITIEELNNTQPLAIVGKEKVRDKFVSIWNTLWGEDAGEAAYEREARYFNAILRDNTDLQQCTPFSIFTAFIDLAVCGLSLEPGARALAYIVSRNSKTGQKTSDGKDIYEKRLKLTISAYGELVQRARAGQIRHADNPVLVYDNDEFSFADRDGRKSVDYVMHTPHTGHRVVACYLRITRTDGSIDYAVMNEEDWMRLAQYSYNNNMYYDQKQGKRVSKGANALYGVGSDGRCNIDTGFLMAKCIKHAFRTYPKLRIGRYTELESSQVEEKEIEINDSLYGMADPATVACASGAGFPATVAADSVSGQETFGNPEQPAGVTVDPGEDDGF